MTRYQKPTVLLLVGSFLMIGCATSSRLKSKQFSNVESFLSRHQKLLDSYDPALGDHYAEDAVLRSTRTGMQGQVTQLEITGAQLRGLLPKALPLARARAERTELSDIRFEQLNGTVRVNATRRMVSKCYEDDKYELILRKSEGQGFLIVREVSATRSRNMCPDEDPRQAMQPLVDQLESRLPLMIDETTRMDQISASTDALTYAYSLIGVAEDELNVEAFVDALRPGILQQVCVFSAYRKILDDGARLVYEYRYESGARAVRIQLSEDDCP